MRFQRARSAGCRANTFFTPSASSLGLRRRTSAPRVGPSKTPTRSSSLKSTSRITSVKSTARRSSPSRLTWPALNVPQDGPTKNSQPDMEGRCGHTTLAGNQCRNKVVQEGTCCRVHAAANQCAVCFSGLVRNLRTLPCGHAFHQKCIDRWKRSCRAEPTCPMCRVPFDLPTYRIAISIKNISQGTVESSEYETSNIQGIQTEFGLDLRVLDAHQDSTLNIVFDIDEDEDLRDVLAAIGIPGRV